MDDGAGGAEACLDAIKPAYDAAIAAGKAVGLGLGLKNSGLGNGFREVSGAVVRFRCRRRPGRGPPRLDRDGPGRAHRRPAGRRPGARHRPGAHRRHRRHDAPARLRPDDRVARHADGRRRGAAGVRRRRSPTAAAPDVDHHGEHVVDWTAKLGDPANPNPTIHAAFGYAAQLAVVDRDSGKVERVVAVHDVGKAVNPQLCAGQIEGSVHMGLGYALTEDFPTDPETGFPTFSTLRQLGILRAKDVPEIEVELVEVPQPRSPYGIKGVGEIGLVPTAPAVAAALHDLDGEWRTTLPMKPRLTAGPVLRTHAGSRDRRRRLDLEST